jgi:hypothetical protein
LYKEYVFGKQTIKQLAERYRVSSRTIHRKLDRYRSKTLISKDKEVIVLMDTTYWGWDFGVVVMKDSKTKKIIWHKYIDRRERLSDYREGIEWLEEKGFKIEGIVCDGLRGIFKEFKRYNIQMCQFHQVQIVRKYLTKQPELEASKELMEIVLLMKNADEESFVSLYNEWYNKWKEFIDQRRIDDIGKRVYIHKRLRSASLSLRRNMPYLWTWYNSDMELPKTNNALEGMFSDLKSKLRNHSGLSKKRRKVFIDEYIKSTFK